MKSVPLARLLAGLAAFICVSVAHGQLTVSGDTTLNSNHPTFNYGSLSNLYVSASQKTLVQFDLSALPAGTTASQIARATVSLYVNRVNTPGLISVAPVNASWNEYSATNATAPAIGTAFTSFTATIPGQYVVIDVTSQVQSWLSSPGTNFGIALTTNAANVLLDAKENDQTSHASSLDVVVTSMGVACRKLTEKVAWSGACALSEG